METNRFIVFFDGTCGMCDRFVLFLLDRDRKKELLFSPLQGNTAKELLGSPLPDGGETMVFWESGKLRTRSTAALRAVSHLGGFWKLLSLLLLIPPPLRNLGYRLVASVRHRLFPNTQCRWVTHEERSRFLS